MVVAGGTPTWRVLTMKMLALLRFGKELAPPLLAELLTGIDLAVSD